MEGMEKPDALSDEYKPITEGKPEKFNYGNGRVMYRWNDPNPNSNGAYTVRTIDTAKEQTVREESRTPDGRLIKKTYINNSSLLRTKSIFALSTTQVTDAQGNSRLTTYEDGQKRLIIDSDSKGREINVTEFLGHGQKKISKTCYNANHRNGTTFDDGDQAIEQTTKIWDSQNRMLDNMSQFGRNDIEFQYTGNDELSKAIANDRLKGAKTETSFRDDGSSKITITDAQGRHISAITIYEDNVVRQDWKYLQDGSGAQFEAVAERTKPNEIEVKDFRRNDQSVQTCKRQEEGKWVNASAEGASPDEELTTFLEQVWKVNHSEAGVRAWQ
jgi:hypothetical protein